MCAWQRYLISMFALASMFSIYACGADSGEPHAPSFPKSSYESSSQDAGGNPYPPNGMPDSASVASESATAPPAPEATPQPDAGEPPENAPPETPEAAKVNPWVDPATDNLSTFAIDVDTASYTYARRLVSENKRPLPSDIRVEEFINYFDYNYDGPQSAPFQVHVDGAISPFEAEHRLLRVGIQGRRFTKAERRALHLTLLIDTSCSMSGQDRLALVKKSVEVLVRQLRPDDTVAIATYAGYVSKVLAPTSGDKASDIVNAINRLHSGGGTAMESGMVLAYQMASQAFVKGHENRVVVFSDGDANIGRTSHTEILKTIENYVKQGITMSTIGYGMGNYKNIAMEQLANKGNGNNYYIDSLEQAERVFEDQFIPNMMTIAKDVKVQVEFNKNYILRYRLVGYENRDIADKDFRNDKVDAGELGAGHNVTALYEVQLKKDAIEPLVQSQSTDPLVIVRLRYKGPDALLADPATEMNAPVPVLLFERPFETTPWTLRWSTAVMAFAEILRKSPYAKTWTLDQVLQIAQSAKNPKALEHHDFITFVQAAKNLP